jgi:acetylcholinesterase
MLYNGGNTGDLFRGAFMQSGFPISVGDLDQGQVYYDFVVQQVGCSTAADTLDCLRTVPYDALSAAFAATPNLSSYRVHAFSLSSQRQLTHFKSLALVYLPRVDGVFLTDNPQQLVLRGEVANVPFVAGSYLIRFSSIRLTSYR